MSKSIILALGASSKLMVHVSAWIPMQLAIDMPQTCEGVSVRIARRQSAGAVQGASHALKPGIFFRDDGDVSDVCPILPSFCSVWFFHVYIFTGEMI